MPKPLRAHAITAVIAIVVSMTGTAFANHVFSDVADASFFGPPIEAIAEAGCAAGFPDGTFRPNQPITRGQFAFWLENCGGRAERHENTATLDTDDQYEDVATISIQPGAVSNGAGQYVTVVASFTAGYGGTDLPCYVEFRINDDGGNAGADAANQVVQIQSNTAAFLEIGAGSLTALIPVDAQNITDIKLQARRPAQTDCDSNISAAGSLLGMSFPFNGDSSGFTG